LREFSKLQAFNTPFLMQISFWDMTECRNPEERSPQLRHC